MAPRLLIRLKPRKVRIGVDARILLEYDEVLQQPHFKIGPYRIDLLMKYLESSAEFYAPIPLTESLPDADEAPFLEVAVAAKANCLVTGNLKHFPARCQAGVQVLSPADFLEFFRQHGL